MKKTVLALLLLCSIIFAFSGGDGTAGNPYQISTVADFDVFCSDTSYWSAGVYVRLSANIDLIGKVYNDSPIAPMTPETIYKKYAGVFYGNGYVIKNLTVSGEHYCGLFGEITTGSYISNLAVENVSITATGTYTGGLVGWNDFGTITNCHATGEVTGTGSVGGLVGRNHSGTTTNCYATGTVTSTGFFMEAAAGGLVGWNEYYSDITNCYATCEVTAPSTVGGLVGCNYNSSTITDCYAIGEVTGGSVIGGLVGQNSFSYSQGDLPTITNCYATGAVTGSSNHIGGLVGWNYNSGLIVNCYATGAVTGEGNNTGGLVGHNWLAEITGCYATGVVDSTGDYYAGGLVGENYSSGKITNCYATGAITGRSGVGGLVGSFFSGEITNCYATGAVAGSFNVGGLVGKNFYNGTTTNCFWDTETSGTTKSTGGTGLMTEEMQTLSTFTGAGWDFVGETANGTNDFWGMTTAVYPVLAWQGYVVTFDIGDHGQTADQTKQFLFYGEAATAPTITANYGYNFTGWDKTFDNITDNLTVNAQYERKTFTVTFNAGEHGSIAAEDVTRYVLFEFAATAPTVVADSHWVFTGWDVGFSNVTSNITVTAQYRLQTYLVTFSAGSNGTITGGAETQTISYGSAATAPTITANESYNFTGWDVDFSSITSAITVTAQYNYEWVGNGTEANPYKISTFVGFEEFCSDTSLWAAGVYVSLETDLDLSEAGTYTKATIACSTGTTSAFVGAAYAGNFDGNGHVISNLTVSGAYYCGLFGKTTGTCSITDLGVEDVSIIAASYYASGLVGYNYGTITNCYATGAIAGNSYVGGLVGADYGTITNCYATGEVAGGSFYTGGLVGDDSGTITNCYATCTVTSTGQSVGGLVGRNYSGTITNCHATGSVTGRFNIGGLSGENSDRITNCYATGAVNSADTVGGLVGKNSISGEITNCYATGSVTGTNVYIGGLVGNDYGTITNCYATGAVDGSSKVGGLVGYHYSGTITNCYAIGEVTGTGDYVGGLVGSYRSGTTTNCFWDTVTSGKTTSEGGTGKTTAEMLSIATYVGWDFVGEDAIWYMPVSGYPYLKNFGYVSGVGDVIGDVDIIQLVCSNVSRTSRTTFEYDITLKIENKGESLDSATFDLIDYPSNITIMQNGSLSTSDVTSGQQAYCAGTIRIRNNRLSEIDSTKVTWRANVSRNSIQPAQIQMMSVDFDPQPLGAYGLGYAEIMEIAESWLDDGIADINDDGIVNYQDIATAGKR